MQTTTPIMTTIKTTGLDLGDSAPAAGWRRRATKPTTRSTSNFRNQSLFARSSATGCRHSESWIRRRNQPRGAVCGNFFRFIVIRWISRFKPIKITTLSPHDHTENRKFPIAKLCNFSPVKLSRNLSKKKYKMDEGNPNPDIIIQNTSPCVIRPSTVTVIIKTQYIQIQILNIFMCVVRQLGLSFRCDVCYTPRTSDGGMLS